MKCRYLCMNLICWGEPEVREDMNISFVYLHILLTEPTENLNVSLPPKVACSHEMCQQPDRDHKHICTVFTVETPVQAMLNRKLSINPWAFPVLSNKRKNFNHAWFSLVCGWKRYAFSWLNLLMLFSSNRRGLYTFKSWQVNNDRCSFKNLQKRRSFGIS